METHNGAKYKKILRFVIELRRVERTNGTEFQGQIPPSSGDQKPIFRDFHFSHFLCNLFLDKMTLSWNSLIRRENFAGFDQNY